MRSREKYKQLVDANTQKNNQIWIKNTNVVRVPRQLNQESQRSISKNNESSLRSNRDSQRVLFDNDDKRACTDDLEKYRSLEGSQGPPSLQDAKVEPRKGSEGDSVADHDKALHIEN